MKAAPEGETEKSKRHHRGTWLITQQDSALSSEQSTEGGQRIEHCDVQHTRGTEHT